MSVAVILLHTAAAWAAEGTPGTFSDDGITVSKAVVEPAAAGGDAAMEMRIRNEKGRLSKLVVVDSEAAVRTTMHRTVGNGEAANMQPVPSIDVPSGAELVLDSADLHVMLVDLKRPLKAGEEVRLRMNFFPGPTLRVAARVAGLEGDDGRDREDDGQRLTNSALPGEQR